MIATFLRDVRRSRGLTQRQLADVSGIGQQNLSAYENGHRVPTADNVNRVLVACGYELAAVAGDRVVYCGLPKVGWFPDEDNPPRLPDDPDDEAPVVQPDVVGTERNRLVTTLLDTFAQ